MKTTRAGLTRGAGLAALLWASGTHAQTKTEIAPPAAEPEVAAEPAEPPPQPAPPPTFSDQMLAGKPIFEVRARYETVDQANLRERANAYTVRTRLGWETGDFHGLKGLIEFEDVRQIGPEHYAVNVPGATTPPLNGADKAR